MDCCNLCYLGCGFSWILLMKKELIKETYSYEVWKTTFSDSGKGYTNKFNKFLCVGGPLHGQMKSCESVKPHSYVQFNAAGGGTNFRCIYLFKELLNANN